MFVSTIGDDGSREVRSEAAILAAVLRFANDKSLRVENVSHKSSILFDPCVNQYTFEFT